MQKVAPLRKVQTSQRSYLQSDNKVIAMKLDTTKKLLKGFQVKLKHNKHPTRFKTFKLGSGTSNMLMIVPNKALHQKKHIPLPNINFTQTRTAPPRRAYII